MARFLLDLDTLDPQAVVLDQSAIKHINPHRHEFELLNRICYLDKEAEIIAGVFEVREDQFWVRGHIPGRPLFPGVLQIEAAAQLSSVLAFELGAGEKEGFFGFFGTNAVRFRRQVTPGDDLVFVAKLIESRRVVRFNTQAFVDGRMVFSGEIHGHHI